MRGLIAFVLLILPVVLYGQEETLYIDVAYKNNSITEALEDLHLRYGVNFSYDQNDLSSLTVNYSVKRSTVAKVLTKLLQGTDYEFQIIGSTYIIKPKAVKAVAVRSIAGIVSDAATGERLPYATVSLDNSGMGALTNKDGFFSLKAPMKDSTFLTISYIGFRDKMISIDNTGPSQLYSLQLNPDVEILDEVLIESISSKTIVLDQVSRITLNPNKLNNLPNMGEKDLMRTIQYFPGISATDETSAGLVIRGGSTDQNLIMFDGFTLYHVDHFYGIFSAFNAEAVKSINISKGGYEPKLGGRVSGVVDITGKSGNENKTSVSFNANLLSVNLALETPISDKFTFFLAGRRAYTDIIQSSLFQDLFEKVVVSTAKNGLLDNPNSETVSPSFYYYDINSKLTFKPNQNNIFSISYYTGEDRLDFNGNQDFEAFEYQTREKTSWGNNGISFNWGRYWNDNFYSNVTAAYSKYSSKIEYGYEFQLIEELGGDLFVYSGDQVNHVEDLSIKIDNEWYFSKGNELDFGLSVVSNAIALESQFENNRYQEYDENGKLYSGYVQHKIQPNNKWNFTYGARVSYYDKVDTVMFEPRVNVVHALKDNFKLKMAAGLYNQTINRAIRGEIYSNTPDFWVLSDKEQIPVTGSYHLIGGATYEKGAYLLDVEGYYKRHKGILEYVPRLTNFEPGDIVSPELYFTGQNEAYGVDVLLHRQKGKHTGWVSYSYLKSFDQFDELNNGKAFPSPNDQRHELNLVNTFKLNRFDLSVAWIFGSGKAYTAPYSEYTVTLLDGTKKKLINLNEINSSRLPAYHRLDLSVSYNFNIGKAKSNIGLTIFNAYNHENIKYRKITRVDFNPNTYYLLESPLYLTTDVTLLGFTPNLVFAIKL